MTTLGIALIAMAGAGALGLSLIIAFERTSMKIQCAVAWSLIAVSLTEESIMFCHEHVIIANRNLRDERIVYTGDNEFFATEESAQKSADRLNRDFDLGLEVFPFVESDWD